MIPYFMNIPERYRRAIDEFVNKARERYGGRIESIILFGSVVRGEAEGDSDIDILVVWRGSKIDGWDALEELAVDILLKYGEYISIKMLYPEEYAGLSKMGSSFIKNIEEEGVVLG